ncbi:ribonuclease P protein subunit p29-like [Amphiura filiformis]|uniref:ribonuclease P protein subunit p29-like n=1 Tax=Amphiura filiformis TaxID=82378 RepID=UPI003B21DE7B
MEGKDLYAQLPAEIKEDKDLLQVPKDPDKFISSFLKRVVPFKDQEGLANMTRSKEVMMDLAIQKKAMMRRKGKKTAKKVLTASQRKEMKLYDIPPEHHNYADYEPLHQLWVDYARDSLNTDRPIVMSQFQHKLLKADLHGSILTVTKSKCPSYVGTSGIMLQETRNVFKIITKENRLKTIPKANSIFTLSLDGLAITIYGNHFRLRASERSVKKFKLKPTIDL